MIDEVCSIFKNEVPYDTLFNDMVYKSMIALRNTRVERLIEERKKQEEQSKRDAAEQQRVAARNKIMG